MAEKYFKQPSAQTSAVHFSQVPAAEIQRSKFDRSHGRKTTFDAGQIIPAYFDEVLPGDTFTMNATAFARLATPLKPIMDNMYLDIHFFFVPYRLVWDSFVNFMGERNNPSDDPSLLSIPQATNINLSTLQNYSLLRHMGIPFRTGVTALQSISALPLRAYVRIWNEWYRDQNLDPVKIAGENANNGPDTFWQDFACLKRMKRHDYFTSCLPWPQKGDPVTIPILDSAPVITTNTDIKIKGTTATERTLQVSNVSGSSNVVAYAGAVINPAENARWGTQTGLVTDLTAATAITINDLRTAFQIQRLLERDARGGTRYIELILSHFGVASDDGRLQRPEYLGGGTSMVNINPIASTFAGGTVAQGQLAAYGTVLGKAGFKKSFTEHGCVFGMVSVRADLTYQQGIERHWFRKTRYDFYWPALANLGEQAVLNREIYMQGTSADNEVFGYQERYAEYRYKQTQITGSFSSEEALSLDVWHLAQDFAALPLLNASFMTEDPPIDRIIAVQDEPHFLADIWFSLQCERPMPVYSVPGMIDHF